MLPPPTARSVLARAAARLATEGVDSPRRTAEWLLEEATGCARARLLLDPALSPEAEARFEAMLARRVAGEPVQYIVGHTEFFGLRVDVSPSVLIPRPETEELVEWAVGRMRTLLRPPWVLDVGTGSGAIALAVKHAVPDAEVFAADVSEAALAVAYANAARLGLDVAFVSANALLPSFAGGTPPAFDFLLSNPPYVPTGERAGLQREVRDHEPPEALYVGDDDPLVFYRALVGHAERLLRPDGWLAVETHAEHGAAVARLFEAGGLAETAVLRDLAGHDRIAVGRKPPEPLE